MTSKLSLSLSKVMSKGELNEFNKRVKIMGLLKKGLTYKQISQKLGVGSATIARVAKKVGGKHSFANESGKKQVKKARLSNYAFGVTVN